MSYTQLTEVERYQIQSFLKAGYTQKAIAQDHQAADGSQLKMALREADAKTDPHHAHQMVGADIAAEDRPGHAPPADAPARQEIILCRLLLTTRDQPDNHDTYE